MSSDQIRNGFVKYLPDNYSELFAVALLGYGEILKDSIDDDGERIKAITRAERRRELMTSSEGLGISPDVVRDRDTIRDFLSTAISSADLARWILIDCFFSDPFVPRGDEEVIKIGMQDRLAALSELATWCGLESPELEATRLGQVIKSAVNSQKAFYQRGTFWALLTVILILGTGGIGWLAAPAIGGMIGVSMGLSGAAATAAGLAALGGGSLAIGGAGMAGGMALMAGLGAAAGAFGAGVVGGGLALAGAMSLDELRLEFVKLQTTYGFVLVGEGAGAENNAAATDVRAALDRLIASYAESADVEDRDKKLKVMVRAQRWMADFEA